MRMLVQSAILAAVVGLSVFTGGPALAHPDMETPLVRPLPAHEDGRLVQAIGVFACPCGAPGKGSLASPSCDCKEANEDRKLLEEGIGNSSEKDLASGKAVVEAILDAIESEPRMRRALRFDQDKFDILWDTTRSVCPAELLKVYRIGPISCRIRATWGLRFKTLLSLDYSVDEIFSGYVKEVNAGLEEDKRYEAHELKYVPPGNVAIILPVVAGALAFIGLRLLRRRRRGGEDIPKGTSGNTGTKSPGGLTKAEEELLREELEDSLEV